MVVPILTRPELLYRMVGSIDTLVQHLVVIDNGNCVNHGSLLKSTDNAEHVSLIRMPSNLGVAASWNLGIKATPMSPYWLIANFDVVWPAGSLAQFARDDAPHSLVLSGGSPTWCAFTLGEEVVREVGLFDESFHPAYYEDTEYEWRCRMRGAPVVCTDIPMHHDNSSTLKAGYMDRNARTYDINGAYYADKVQREDLTDGRWSLTRRRELTWD